MVEPGIEGSSSFWRAGRICLGCTQLNCRLVFAAFRVCMCIFVQALHSSCPSLMLPWRCIQAHNARCYVIMSFTQCAIADVGRYVVLGDFQTAVAFLLASTPEKSAR
eukprot:scaffold141599_cov18-Tisochrysis_lutea.AAC.1